MVQVARGVEVISDEGGDILCHSTKDRQDDILHHFWWRKAFEASVVHPGLEQLVFALQGELPVRLELESQVGDGVRRRHPVPWVFEVWAEAQVQAQDPSVVAMAHLRGLSSMPIIPKYAATACTPSMN